MGNEEEKQEEDQEKRVKHYSSNQRLLLVGEGDFSFSSSLAQSFGCASNIVATSLDSYDDVIKKYKKAKSNLENLLKLGASIIHGVDTTKMKLHSDLKMQKFDRIIYNFPHAGFHGKEDNVRLIEKHKKLVLGFFKNASGMLRASGQIHVTHKTSAPFCHWNIEELAWKYSLALVECVEFRIEDYPGYNNKRGDGKRCDEPFPLGDCSTFKFRFNPAIKKMSKVIGHSQFTHKRPEFYQDIAIQTHYQPTSFHNGLRPSPLSFHARSGNLFNGQFNHVTETYQRPITRVVDYFANRARECDIKRYMTDASGRFQDYQGDPFKLQHQRTEFNQNMNEFRGYMGAPLRISVQEESASAAHRNVNYIASRLRRCNYESYVDGRIRRSQYLQGNPFKMQYQPASFSPIDFRTELNRTMNQLPWYMEEPLTISIRMESDNAWHRDVDNFANRAQGCGYMTEASGRSHHFQDNPFKMQHQQDSFSPMDHYCQTEFNEKTNEFISIRKETVNAWHRDVDYIANQALGCDYQWDMAKESARSQHYGSVNASKRVLRL